MSTLYMMVGLPGSGKSTWASKFMQEYHSEPIAYISRDAIRLAVLKPTDSYFARETEVFDKWADTIASHLRAGHDVIADATHTSRGARGKLINALLDRGMGPDNYDIVCVVMTTSVDECVARDALREGRAHVTEDRIRDWARGVRRPYVGEFENIKEVRLVE